MAEQGTSITVIYSRSDEQEGPIADPTSRRRRCHNLLNASQFQTPTMLVVCWALANNILSCQPHAPDGNKAWLGCKQVCDLKIGQPDKVGSQSWSSVVMQMLRNACVLALQYLRPPE